jgi:uncharacterized protein (DUF1501 family)
LRSLVTAPSSHLFEADHARIMSQALAAHESLTAALAGAPALTTEFPTGNALADELKMVARLVSVAGTLGARRQVFFVGLGGFDTHSTLGSDHPQLLGQLASALAAFQASMEELGTANQVTAFTASDFGRTLTVNDGGSDHGWGSMHFILGGAVQGQRYYGQPPVVASDGADDVGQGRLLPTTSVDQYAATLGGWFGCSDQDLLAALPNLANFDPAVRRLGFL